MPSDRQQLNVRLDPQTSDLWASLVPRVEAALGVELSQAQIVTLALRALSEKYPAAQPPTTAEPARSKGRPRKRKG